jgi:hypothetical protein
MIELSKIYKELRELGLSGMTRIRYDYPQSFLKGKLISKIGVHTPFKDIYKLKINSLCKLDYGESTPIYLNYWKE